VIATKHISMGFLGRRSPPSSRHCYDYCRRAEEKIISEIVVFIARVEATAAAAAAALFLLYGRQLSRKKALAFLLIVASINELFLF
jgi:hypothetical protein